MAKNIVGKGQRCSIAQAAKIAARVASNQAVNLSDLKAALICFQEAYRGVSRKVRELKNRLEFVGAFVPGFR